MSIVPELLHLLLDDPPLVVAGAVVVGVHEDAVQVPPQLVLLMQDPINLGHSELLRDRRPRLNIEIFSLNSNIFSEFLFFSVSSLKLPAYGFALPPRQYRLRDGIVPELFSKHLLGERDYGAEEEGHPVVGLLEGDDEDVVILDLVQQRRHQVLDEFLLLHQLVAWKQLTLLLASNIFFRKYQIYLPKPGVSIMVKSWTVVLPSLAMAAKLTSSLVWLKSIRLARQQHCV